LAQLRARRSAELTRSQVDQIYMRTDEDLVMPLLAFFQRRAKK
jgi:hypothetical protein